MLGSLDSVVWLGVLGQFWCDDDLVDVVVVEDEVGVFKVNQCVAFVRLQTAVAVSVLALVARKHDLLLLVRLHLAVAFGPVRLVVPVRARVPLRRRLRRDQLRLARRHALNHLRLALSSLGWFKWFVH